MKYDYLQGLDIANLKFDQLPYIGCHLWQYEPDYPESRDFCKTLIPEKRQTIFAEAFKRGWAKGKPTIKFAKNCQMGNRFFVEPSKISTE